MKNIDTWLGDRLGPLVTGLFARLATPVGSRVFEEQLRFILRGPGRNVVEWAFNAAEPAEAYAQPHVVRAGARGYLRLRDKPPSRDVASLFGRVTLWRRGYLP